MSLRSTVARWLPPPILNYIRRSLVPNSAWKIYGYPSDAGLQAEEAYEKVGWVYGCVRVIARNIAQVPFYAVRSVPGRGKGRIDQLPDSHPLSQLLLHPNEENDFSGIIEATSTGLGLRGEAFWEFDAPLRGENGKPRPVRIHARPPQWITEVHVENEQYASYDMRVPSLGRLISVPGDMGLLFKCFNPTNPWRGLAPMTAAFQAADSYYAAQLLNSKFFKRGAIPSLAIGFDEKSNVMALDKVQRDRILEDMQKMYGGLDAESLHGVLVLGPGEKPFPIGSDLKDMHFEHYMRFNKDEILAVYGVTPIMLGGVEDANRANSVEQRKFFWEETAIPQCDDIVTLINRKIAPRFGSGVFVRADYSQVPALRRDLKSLGDGVLPWVSAYVLTINEAREDYLDLPPVEWGDEPFDINKWNVEEESVAQPTALPPGVPEADGEQESFAFTMRRVVSEWKNATISRIREGAQDPLRAFPPGREAKKARRFGLPQEIAWQMARAASLELSVKWRSDAPQSCAAEIFDSVLEQIPAEAGAAR